MAHNPRPITRCRSLQLELRAPKAGIGASRQSLQYTAGRPSHAHRPWRVGVEGALVFLCLGCTRCTTDGARPAQQTGTDRTALSLWTRWHSPAPRRRGAVAATSGSRYRDCAKRLAGSIMAAAAGPPSHASVACASWQMSSPTAQTGAGRWMRTTEAASDGGKASRVDCPAAGALAERRRSVWGLCVYITPTLARRGTASMRQTAARRSASVGGTCSGSRGGSGGSRVTQPSHRISWAHRLRRPRESTDSRAALGNSISLDKGGELAAD